MAKPKKQKSEPRESLSVVLRFSEDHVWVRVEGDRVQIGLSDSAQRSLGAIIAADLPEVGDQLEQGEQFGELESRRKVQELFAPLTGEVTAVNGEIEANPALVNEDPHHDGWLLEMSIADERELDDLMTPEEYDELAEQDEQDE